MFVDILNSNFNQNNMRKLLLFSFFLALGLLQQAYAQERKVTGIVTSSEDGAPLPGTNVLVKGTSNGTITGVDGKFSLNVPEDATLVFSSIGYVTQEVVVGNRSTIDLVLKVDVKQLSEIVVTAVGIEANKQTLGYAIQNVNAEDLVNARETNLVNALNSKVAGVSVVSSSGSPGASANIRIRGNSSVLGNNSPLFVVDGVPIDNSSTGNNTGGVDNSNRAIDLNANDIASMSVLKGPAATVLYGIRAANGAIIITTKKGQKGRPVVSFNSTYTVDKVNKLPELQKEYVQGRPVSGVPTWRGPHTGEGFSWGPKFSDLEYDGSQYPYDKNGRLVPKGTGNGVPARPYDAYETFFVNGVTKDNNLSVSGGNDVTTYYLSAGRLAQTGIIPNSDFFRSSFKATINTKITEKLSAGASANYVNSGSNYRVQRGSNISGVMLGLARNTPSFDIGNGKKGMDAASDPATYEIPGGGQRGYRGGIYDNPFWTVNRNPSSDNVNRIIGNVNVAYDIVPGLKATYKLGVDQFSDKRLSGIDIGSATNNAGAVTMHNIDNSNINSDFLLIFNKSITPDFQVDALVGHNYFSSESTHRSTFGQKLGAPSFFHISNASNVQASESIGRRKVHGVFSNVNLSYKGYLFLNLSGRNDWSSTLPANNNSFFYPAASVGFAFTELLDMSTNTYLPYGKLRASYGQVGNDAPLYVTSSYYNSARIGGDGFITPLSFPAFGVNAFERSGQLGNTDLRAELTTTYEVGGDFKFFKGRAGLDITYYQSISDGQIIPVDISATTGFTSMVRNAGKISNKGLEIVLNTTPVEVNGFRWDLDLNFTRYRSIVEELGVDNIGLAGFTSTSSRVVVGQPYGAIFGSRWLRDDQGRKIIDKNGWPMVNPIDGVVADPTPDFLAGIRNTFTYKGIRVSGLLDIRKGGAVWNGTEGILDYFGTSKRSGDEREVKGHVFEGVTEEGKPNTTPVDFANPANGINSYKWTRYGFGVITEEAVQDASWLRLRELTVSYELPNSLISKAKLSRASVAVTGRNLFLYTPNYTGIDPETNLTGASNGIGLEYFNMPNTKSVGVTLNLTF